MNILDFTKQKFVQRWNGRKTLSDFNLLEHSARVTHFSRMLINSVKSKGFVITDSDVISILEYSLYHDLPEVFLNDITSPAKKQYPELDKILKSIECDILAPYDLKTNDLAKFVCKLADILDCYFEACSEIGLGNKDPEFNLVVNGFDDRVKETYYKFKDDIQLLPLPITNIKFNFMCGCFEIKIAIAESLISIVENNYAI